MKKDRLNRTSYVLAAAVLLAAVMTGCGRNDEIQKENGGLTGDMGVGSNQNGRTAGQSGIQTVGTELEVRFGDDGEPFILHLEDNGTAEAVARHVGTSDWRLPIYHYDDYENWEVMQYYDIPDRYEIPSNAETVTSEKAGEVYYSEPNRIVLFYQDGSVTGELTKIGSIADTDEFRKAVEDNPVLEGWGNKIVLISSRN
ncbi:cyclophilin-like fold protein [Clostridium sp. AM58-1XD]|uniref:cyclophilin-like fold protein n=1 Tax=Clostridium sp. AM58-1XD TaxID=2292307 RepID=UPI000E536EFD|nr:cyclophilin-like fold protein [Clostridium sp. AM58-1XD]RGY97932.1 hypothetical protein DXA13_12775 [Clostridium sp. AM58-1XD]